MKNLKKINLVLIICAAVLAVVGTFFVHAAYAQAAGQPVPQQPLPTAAIAAGFISAALAVGLSCIAAGIAVSNVGSAAMGALSEKPELAGRALIFVGLAEGIAIYGLIVAIMIVGKIV